jgi:hypothetical protein
LSYFLFQKGAYLPTLFYNDSNIEKASTEAVLYAKQSNLADFRKEKSAFKPKPERSVLHESSPEKK